MTLGEGQIRADYADRFRCIGPACEDTCCAGWRVYVDRATYDKYQGMIDSPLHGLLQERVQANPGSESEYDFAQVQLDPGHRCPFLSSERLCSIQVEHGAGALSSTCASYPRAVRRIDGQEDVSLHLSCPEAARIVLLDRNFLRPNDRRLDRRERYRRFAAMAGSLPPASGNPFQYLWEVRRLAFLLLQDRSYPLWQRLFVLGMFCRRLAAAGPQARAVPELLQSYGEIMAQEKLRGAIERIPARLEAQFVFAIDMLDSLRRLNLLPERFLECLRDCLEGVGHTEGTPIAGSAPGYIEASTRQYAPFAKKHSYMLENYLLSYVIRERFPYGDEAQPRPSAEPLLEFTLMALRFALIKGVLIGMAGRYRQNLAPSHVVKLVQSFSKGVEHSSAARAEMVKCIRAGNLDRSDALAMMLRN